MRARYDDIATWYDAWVADSQSVIFQTARDLCPEDLRGERVLDVACGQGRLSRDLARAGALVHGVDLSTQLITRARDIEVSEPLGITYTQGDIAGLPQDELYDGAACDMALMDIDDLKSALTSVASVLRPNAWFVASMVHPCFPGTDTGLSSWPPEAGYAAEGFWNSAAHHPEGARLRVGSNHRMLSTYLNVLADAGLPVVRMHEPPDDVPTTLVVRCRKASA